MEIYGKEKALVLHRHKQRFSFRSSENIPRRALSAQPVWHIFSVGHAAWVGCV